MKPDKSDVQGKIIKIIRTLNDNGLRIGQIISNVFDEIAKDGTDPFYVDDTKFLEFLEKYSKN